MPERFLNAELQEIDMIRETFPVGPLRCNCTVLGDEATREAIVVDPGGDVTIIEAVLTKYALRLKQILVTHAHLDHIAGAKLLHDRTGTPVIYHELDLPLVAIMDQQARWMNVPTPEIRLPDEIAKDGMLLRLGAMSVEVLHTPGHTAGSLSLHLPGDSLLLAGDTLFRGSIGRTDLPGGNPAQIVRSIQQRLLHLPEGTVVVPGHGAETTIGLERETNPWLQNV